MYQTRGERAKSYFYNMRKFHNDIKRDLYNRYTNRIEKLLDLASGKGGDLDKWISNKIKIVKGYDINDKSIKEAKRRLTEYSTKHDYKIDFNVLDLSKNVIPGDRSFDVISCMFAFHYFFKSAETFETIMETIDRNLKPDGYFIGTMFDGRTINSILKNREYTIKDENDNIRFQIVRPTDNNYYQSTDMFGKNITVYLKDTVLDIPEEEYLVDFERFTSEMELRGYELVETKMFSELYLYNIRHNLNEIEKKVSFLNRTFIFRRKTKDEIIKMIKEGYTKTIENKINETSDKNKQEIYRKVVENISNLQDYIATVKDTRVKEYIKGIDRMYKNEISMIL